MWFKNLIIYRFSKPFTMQSQELEERLSETAFKPCSKHELSSYGWVSPMGRNSEVLCHSANGYSLICAKREDKILPSSVIKEMLQERVQILEQEQHRKLYKKEKDSLKDEITLELLPRAFSKSSCTFAYISPSEGLLIVDSSSAKRAEDLTSSLRSALGSLPIVPPVLINSPSSIMTDWVQNGVSPEPFVLGNESELKEPTEEGGILSCKRQDLASEEIALHLQSGKLVSKLALTWDEQISFILNEDFSIKRMKFGEVLQEKASEDAGDDSESRIDADFALMTLSLKDLLKDLTKALGGEDMSRVDS